MCSPLLEIYLYLILLHFYLNIMTETVRYIKNLYNYLYWVFYLLSNDCYNLYLLCFYCIYINFHMINLWCSVHWLYTEICYDLGEKLKSNYVLLFVLKTIYNVCVFFNFSTTSAGGWKMTTDISIVRWDPTLQQEIVEDYEYDGGNSSSRLFERSRIKALAGMDLACNKLLICLHILWKLRRRDE